MTSNQQVMPRPGQFIGGQWVPSTGSGRIDVVNPATEDVIAQVAAGTAEDVDAAVHAAAQAFPDWSGRSRDERVAYCTAIADAFEAKAAELAAIMTSELGVAIGFSRIAQVGVPIATFGSMAQVVNEIRWEETVGNSLVLREPVGIVGAITPWNFPLHQIAAKLAPALTAGCTVVLKPSELTPLSAIALVDILQEVGLPAGVVNVVNGTGAVVGEAITSHPAVDMVTFTGSTVVGRRISEVAATTVKRVALELGGKNANILLDGADLSKAVPNAVTKGYLNAGQACLALSRLLVPRARQAEVEEIITGVVTGLKVGDPTEPDTDIGPLVSAEQKERVIGFIRGAEYDGARLVTEGDDPSAGGRGYYVRPTVFADVRRDSALAVKEVFGPVIAILPYDTEEEAVEIANETIYGLGGAVWGRDVEDAMRVAKSMRTGTVEVNGADYNPLAPVGGFRQSGNGREFGWQAIEEYLMTKSIQR